MQLPEDYKTGNKGMDEKILQALLKARDDVQLLQTRLLQRASEKTNKYHVVEKEDRTYKDGTLFASKAEMERWDDLLMLERSRKILNLRRQIPFILQESFSHSIYGTIPSITYVSDFVYTNLTLFPKYPNMEIVEDNKGGMRTGEYKIKRKLFLMKYPSYIFIETK